MLPEVNRTTMGFAEHLPTHSKVFRENIHLSSFDIHFTFLWYHHLMFTKLPMYFIGCCILLSRGEVWLLITAPFTCHSNLVTQNRTSSIYLIPHIE